MNTGLVESVQVDSTKTVMVHLARVKAAGIPVHEEMGVNCCHANQDKFWVRDPDGVEWEIYHVKYDLPPAASLEVPCCAGQKLSDRVESAC